MDPDVSSTSSTLARLRSDSQDFATWSSTAGAGGSMTATFRSGSAPFSLVSAAPGLPLASRNAASVNRFCCAGSVTKARKSAAARFFAWSTHSAVSTTYGLSETSVPSFG